ncbi:MAG: hypothetical protein U9Q07_04855, partial [Planctomycetota bacterium]|nr:hypothetical protein [Planctomycetota bacterium]
VNGTINQSGITITASGIPLWLIVPFTLYYGWLHEYSAWKQRVERREHERREYERDWMARKENEQQRRITAERDHV